MTKNYLNKDQLYTLNALHGYFEYRDAQGDVSREFANSAIEIHERVRAAAPDLLSALIELVNSVDNLGHAEGGLDGLQYLNEHAHKAAILIREIN